MSHLFISYAHADKAHLDRLVAWLRDNDFADGELWYDRHIEGGSNWRDEITTALDEAFAIVVLVTTNSVKSLYCTYEWAYGLGQGIPILPLVFDEVSVTDVPAPLTAKQFTSCIVNIPSHLKEQVKRLKTLPPHVAAINRIVYETVYDIHRQFFILGWIGEGLNALDGEFRETVLNHFIRKSFEAHQKLEALMMDKAFALSGKQTRQCWILIDLLSKFSHIQSKYDEYLPEHLFSQFDSSWLPAFEYFEGDGWWSRWMRRYFERDLEDAHNRMAVFAEMVRVFPMMDATDADILVHNMNIDRKRKQQ